MITRQHSINIVTAALLYNYLANNNYSLEMDKINQYIEFVTKLLQTKHQIYDIDLSMRTTNIYLDSFFIIGDLRTRMSASLNLSSDLLRIYNEYIKYLPSELITESLNQDALRIIGVDKEKLKVCYDQTVFNITHDLYEKNDSIAKEKAINLLKKQGKKDIKIIDLKKEFVGDKYLYHINLSYTRPREYLSDEIFTEKEKTKKKRFTSYYGF